MGPTTVVQDVPPLLMIEYGIDGVCCVTPHRAGRDEHTIADRLDALADHGEWVAPPCQRRLRS
jgi:queuine/archaeosine tRNA-ribosyltransferase